MVGGSYITGVVDGKGELTGDDIAYIYQDLTTAFVGRFEDGIMVKERNARNTKAGKKVMCAFYIISEKGSRV